MAGFPFDPLAAGARLYVLGHATIRKPRDLAAALKFQLAVFGL
jgi:hypothetical protein